jgi:4-hydroxy-tetrahydrodipicolinate synthase
VTSNVAPRLCAELHAAWKRRDLDRVEELNDRLMPLHQALFIESSPSPVKFAAKLLGHCDDEVRLPLVRTQPETQLRVRSAMVHAGLLN